MVVPCFECPYLEGWVKKPRGELDQSRADELGLYKNESIIIVKCSKARHLLQFFERYLTSEEEAPTCHYKLFKESKHKTLSWLKDLYDEEILNLKTTLEFLEEMKGRDAVEAVLFLRKFFKVWYKWKLKRR